MTKYSKYNIVYHLQKWMDSVPGQTFLNYAYSWGAAVVILGTLFKLTHLPGANVMLFLGMGTEVFVFFLSAFDRPFDKTADGRELPTRLTDETDEYETEDDYDMEPSAAPAQGITAGGTIIIGGGMAATTGNAADGNVAAGAQTVVPAAASAQGTAGDGQAIAAAQAQGGMMWMAQQQSATPEMAEAQGNYVDALNSLTEMLQKVSAQSERLTRDSEEMENLNRTLTGITKIYEMQLKAASQQVGTIDQINDQTRKMAALIEQLNSIYGRMIEAMTANMTGKAAL